jgi:hypothetical protein
LEDSFSEDSDLSQINNSNSRTAGKVTLCLEFGYIYERWDLLPLFIRSKEPGDARYHQAETNKMA